MSWKTPFLLRKAVTPFSSGRTMSSATFGSVFEEETVPSGPHEAVEWGEEPEEDYRWSRMPPELLGEIIRKVEESEDRWPMRKSVVSCACVCRRWREITVGIVRELRGDRVITFPSSLKQPGPKEAPLQCCIKRDRANSAFRLYLSLTHTFMESGKFLLAARRVRHGAFIEYIISLDADDISQSNNAYVGKLCSDFLGTKFTLYDCKPPFFGAKASSNRRSRRFVSKQISPEVSAGNFVIGLVSYKFNFLRSRGPRRMICNLQSPNKETSKEEVWKNSDLQKSTSSPGTIALKNNAPRWHEHLQCWCLNFHGRVTVASVKNFQLAAADTSQPPAQGDEENVILQFGKIGEDIFSMDYREPLSAFQAFAICLTSFGTKLACE